MVVALILALACQEQARTVEDRLKELEAKLAGLEERSKKLAAENAQLEKRQADAKAAREGAAKQAASAWVKRYAKEAEFSETQTAELEALWVGWTKEDFQKPADAAKWKTREEELRRRVTPDQTARLAREVGDDQVKQAKGFLAIVVKAARLPAERTSAVENVVLEKLRLSREALIPRAHPEGQADWSRILRVLHESATDVAAVLNEEEAASWRKALEGWKPLPVPGK